MPYITKEQVAAKRAAIKKALPEFKLSITTENYSGIKVAIMRGPSLEAIGPRRTDTCHDHSVPSGRAAGSICRIPHGVSL